MGLNFKPEPLDPMLFKTLSAAVVRLAKSIEESNALAKANLATKADLNAAKEEIIKAFGERVDPAAVRDLKKAVDANQPKISGS